MFVGEGEGVDGYWGVKLDGQRGVDDGGFGDRGAVRRLRPSNRAGDLANQGIAQLCAIRDQCSIHVDYDR